VNGLLLQSPPYPDTDRIVVLRTAALATGEIVGVMPPGFQFPNRTDVWTPQTNRAASRTSHSFLAVARLKPGVSLKSAETELNTIAARFAQQYPDSNKGRGVSTVPPPDRRSP